MIASKRIILATFGSYGDIHPYLAIAAGCIRVVTHPVIATSELYREKLVAGGFNFVPVRPHIPPPQEQDPAMMEKVMNPKSGSGFLLNEMLFPFVREGYEDLLRAVAGADLLLTHPISFAGPLVAQRRACPGSRVCSPQSHSCRLTIRQFHLSGRGCSTCSCSAHVLLRRFQAGQEVLQEQETMKCFARSLVCLIVAVRYLKGSILRR